MIRTNRILLRRAAACLDSRPVLETGRPRVVVRPAGGPPAEVAVTGPGASRAAGVEVHVAGDDRRLEWSVSNPGDAPVALDAVALAWDAGPAADGACLYVNGYQSWSPAGRRAFGADEDPSRHPDSIAFLRVMHHADPGVADAGELRSEAVTVVDAGRGPRRLAGFAGGATHEGTLRARLDGGRLALRAEAWLGGAVLAPGETRPLHAVVAEEGDDPAALLDGWAAAAGRAEAARVAAPYQVGWCSWYHYFHEIGEAALRDNLARAGDWPFDVFQLDDGYQAAIGDWLDTNERFPSGVAGVAGAIAAAGHVPGIWIAPFLAAPDSALARAHPDWMARGEHGEPLVGMWHEVWGGFMWALDVTLPEVQDHLAAVAAGLVAAGYRYLKLDFTFSATVPGGYADPSRTPAERLRLGYEAVRRGAGDDVFVLGCGCPLGAVVGVVDGMRIGPDVAPAWDAPEPGFPGYEGAAPSTRHAFVNTLARSAFHRRLWLNDPDCVMLRTSHTGLGADAARAWALAVGVSGGLALVSDDLALLDADARALLDEVVALGRAADGEARTGPAPRCLDLLDAGGPSRLAAAGAVLHADPADPHATLTRPA